MNRGKNLSNNNTNRNPQQSQLDFEIEDFYNKFDSMSNIKQKRLKTHEVAILAAYINCLPILRLISSDIFFAPLPEDVFKFYSPDTIFRIITIVKNVVTKIFHLDDGVFIELSDDLVMMSNLLKHYASRNQVEYEAFILSLQGNSVQEGGGQENNKKMAEVFKNIFSKRKVSQAGGGGSGSPNAGNDGNAGNKNSLTLVIARTTGNQALAIQPQLFTNEGTLAIANAVINNILEAQENKAVVELRIEEEQGLQVLQKTKDDLALLQSKYIENVFSSINNWTDKSNNNTKILEQKFGDAVENSLNQILNGLKSSDTIINTISVIDKDGKEGNIIGKLSKYMTSPKYSEMRLSDFFGLIESVGRFKKMSANLTSAKGVYQSFRNSESLWMLATLSFAAGSVYTAGQANYIFQGLKAIGPPEYGQMKLLNGSIVSAGCDADSCYRFPDGVNNEAIFLRNGIEVANGREGLLNNNEQKMLRSLQNSINQEAQLWRADQAMIISELERLESNVIKLENQKLEKENEITMKNDDKQMEIKRIKNVYKEAGDDIKEALNIRINEQNDNLSALNDAQSAYNELLENLEKPDGKDDKIKRLNQNRIQQIRDFKLGKVRRFKLPDEIKILNKQIDKIPAIPGAFFNANTPEKKALKEQLLVKERELAKLPEKLIFIKDRQNDKLHEAQEKLNNLLGKKEIIDKNVNDLRNNQRDHEKRLNDAIIAALVPIDAEIQIFDQQLKGIENNLIALKGQISLINKNKPKEPLPNPFQEPQAQIAEIIANPGKAIALRGKRGEIKLKKVAVFKNELINEQCPAGKIRDAKLQCIEAKCKAGKVLDRQLGQCVNAQPVHRIFGQEPLDCIADADKIDFQPNAGMAVGGMGFVALYNFGLLKSPVAMAAVAAASIVVTVGAPVTCLAYSGVAVATGILTGLSGILLAGTALTGTVVSIGSGVSAYQLYKFRTKRDSLFKYFNETIIDNLKDEIKNEMRTELKKHITENYVKMLNTNKSSFITILKDNLFTDIDWKTVLQRTSIFQENMNNLKNELPNLKTYFNGLDYLDITLNDGQIDAYTKLVSLIKDEEKRRLLVPQINTFKELAEIELNQKKFADKKDKLFQKIQELVIEISYASYYNSMIKSLSESTENRIQTINELIGKAVKNRNGSRQQILQNEAESLNKLREDLRGFETKKIFSMQDTTRAIAKFHSILIKQRFEERLRNKLALSENKEKIDELSLLNIEFPKILLDAVIEIKKEYASKSMDVRTNIQNTGIKEIFREVGTQGLSSVLLLANIMGDLSNAPAAQAKANAPAAQAKANAPAAQAKANAPAAQAKPKLTIAQIKEKATALANANAAALAKAQVNANAAAAKPMPASPATSGGRQKFFRKTKVSKRKSKRNNRSQKN